MGLMMMMVTCDVTMAASMESGNTWSLGKLMTLNLILSRWQLSWKGMASNNNIRGRKTQRGKRAGVGESQY